MLIDSLNIASRSYIFAILNKEGLFVKQNSHKGRAGIMHKRSIIKKTIQVGGSTMLSRVLAIIREVLLVRFLGVGAISDAFFTAYKIPNSLRKIFAEGALSAAMIPTVVSILRKKNKRTLNKFVSLAFLVFEGLLLILCGLAIWKAQAVIRFAAPGFSPEQVVFTARLLQVLMPFIFFLSSSALLAGPLQSVGHFFVPAISPALLNVVFIGAISICLTFSLSVEHLCFFILFGGLVQLLFHIWTYFRLDFSFERPDQESWSSMKHVMRKFLPCLFSMSIVEVSLFVDTMFASWLPKGSVTLIYYANRFMGIPLGVFGAAFSTILLPHFSKLSLYAPKRISFYLLEATKFVFWISLPIACMMIFFSEKIFSTIFLSSKFSLVQVQEAGVILIAFLLGLFFFSLNKILLNIYYSFHNMWIPTVVSIIATIINVFMNMLLMKKFAAVGIALATTISAVLQMCLFLVFLMIFFNFKFYGIRFVDFVVRYVVQLCLVFIPTYFLYTFLLTWIGYLPQSIAYFFLQSIGFWLWVGPLCLLAFLIIYHTRRWFRVKLYFLD